MGVKELAELAEYDSTAKEFFNTFGKNLGCFLVPWIKKFGAECIVLGGNISKSYVLFSNEMQQQFQNENVEIMVHVSNLDEDAALIGSAKLCDNEYYSKLIL